ncbi:MAG: hypothetical protein V1837_03360 [Candidatus Woesearchaeota archaeon]
MDIPEPFLSIIKKHYSAYALVTSDELSKFFNGCFKELIKTLNITDYQARAAKTGKIFEYAFYYLVRQKFGFNLANDVSLRKACMCDGGELDFAVFKKEKPIAEANLVCGIEAKGSDPDSSERPALKRTDTMKKAISQAYQFKRVYPKLPFFVVSNVLPDSGNSLCMMKLAEGDIVDEFIDVTDIKQLQKFVDTIKAYQ